MALNPWTGPYRARSRAAAGKSNSGWPTMANADSQRNALSGYYVDDAATAAVLRDSWLHTEKRLIR